MGLKRDPEWWKCPKCGSETVTLQRGRKCTNENCNWRVSIPGAEELKERYGKNFEE